MNIIKIIKKELDKIFKFPRQIFTTLILPGLLLFAIYAFIGTGLNSKIEDEEEINSVIYVVNSPESLDGIYSISNQFKVELHKATNDELESLKESILNGTINAVLVYEENFDDKIQNDPLPKVDILYDSSSMNSYIVLQRAQTVIAYQEQQLLDKLNINPNLFSVNIEYIEPDEQSAGMILAMILPMILMSFIFGSALGIGSDAIAGEKERGTLATLLMLPIKRSDIIIGKIISTSTITVISAISSFVGLLLSLPFAKTMFAIDANSAISYSALDILGLIVILLLIALLASSVLLIISTIAKNIKEATTMAMPVYIAAILAPVITMFSSNQVSSKAVYLIPIYNTILGIKEILSFNFNIVNFIIIIVSTLSYVTIFVFILIKMFRSEKVLYAK